jgi:hypothetical protein
MGLTAPFVPSWSVYLVCKTTVIGASVDGMDVTSNYVPGLADQGLMEDVPAPPVYDPTTPPPGMELMDRYFPPPRYGSPYPRRD